jgi:hypothetical protein
MKPAQRWLLAVLALLGVSGIIAGAVWLFRATHERIEIKVPMPMRGEALRNPLYALREGLKKDGVPVHSRRGVEVASFSDDPTATVLVHAPLDGLSVPEQTRILDWVEGGGHLLLRLPGKRGEQAQVPDLLLELGVLEALEEPQCEPLRLPGQPTHEVFCSARRFSLDEDVEPRLAWPAQGPHVFARLDYGRGSVDVLADFQFLENGDLRQRPHQDLVRQLLAPNYGRGPVHLVHAASAGSRLPALLAASWPVWLPLLVLLLAWVWRHGQRFGPWLPTPAQERRSLLEHVRASGELLYRYGRLEDLHACVRQAFLARLQRHDPVAASLSGDERIQAIARRVELSPQEVRQALQRPQPRDRQAFQASVRTLILMRNRL